MILNCTATQVENLITPPIITWIAPDGSMVPNKREGTTASAVTVNPQTDQLIFNEFMSSSKGSYTCRAIVNIPEAQIDNHFDEATVEVNSACKSMISVQLCYYLCSHQRPYDFVVPGVVQDLECSKKSSSRTLTLSWALPRESGNQVTGYQVVVNRLEHRRGTKEVFQSSVYNNFTVATNASIYGLGNDNKIDPAVLWF